MKIGDKAKIRVKTASGWRDVTAEVKKHPNPYGNGMIIGLKGFEAFVSCYDIRYETSVTDEEETLGQFIADEISVRWGFEVEVL